MPWKAKTHNPLPGVSKAMERTRDRMRGTRTQRGYTNEWLRASAAFLALHPLCVMCMAIGQRVPAEVTDHVIPHKGNMQLFWDQANWQPLCKLHHDRKTGSENAGC